MMNMSCQFLETPYFFLSSKSCFYFVLIEGRRGREGREGGKEREVIDVMQMHIDAVHLNTKYNCDTCQFQASWKNDLMRHMKEVHLGTRFKCDQCSYETSRNYLLKKHVKAKHPESKIDETDSPLKLQSTKVAEVKLEIPPEDIKVEEFYL